MAHEIFSVLFRTIEGEKNGKKEGKLREKKPIENQSKIRRGSQIETKTVSSRYKFHFMSIEHIFKAAPEHYM